MQLAQWSVGVLSVIWLLSATVMVVAETVHLPDEVKTHTVDTPYLHAAAQIRVLLPGPLEPGRHYPVLYVLPVAAGPDEEIQAWGDGIHAIRGDSYLLPHENLAKRYGLICVFPTFDSVPWFGDGQGDAGQRHESHLLKVVLPFIEQNYPTIAEPRGRLLMGFSKSGFGAFGLLLRNPGIFGRAAAFDAPLMVDWPGSWGIKEHFGSSEAFAGWHIPDLLAQHARELQGDRRLILLGYCLFRDHVQQANALLHRLGIPHEYRDGPERIHHWYSGWVSEAVALLMAPASVENRPPSLQDLAQAVRPGTAMSITPLSADQDGDDVSYSITAQPVHGTAMLVGQRIVYTPSNGYQGPDQLSITGNDGVNDSRPAQVFLTVIANRPPLSGSGKSGGTLAPGGARGGVISGSDPDGDPLSFSIVTQPQHGRVSLDARITHRRVAGQPPQGTVSESLKNFTYTADAAYAGSDFFEFAVNDGTVSSGTSRMTFTITAR